MTAWREPDALDEGAFEPEEVFEAGLRNHHVSSTAYPIAHESTWRPYRVPREAMEERTVESFRSLAEIGLYAHVPFCETRCSFCEYTVTRRSEHAGAALYMDALLRELSLYDGAIDLRRKTLAGFDIGGGTPSFVPAEEIERLVAAVREKTTFREGADISIETTPRIAAVERSKIRAYRAAGIDRVSMGTRSSSPLS
jgi:oxygen-independent coproporphyrinogen-3 oxidase